MKPISITVSDGMIFILCEDGKVYRRVLGAWELVAQFEPPAEPKPKKKTKA